MGRIGESVSYANLSAPVCPGRNLNLKIKINSGVFVKTMRIVAINIPDSYLTAFEFLIKLGLYNSRSQIVREALKDFLTKEQDFTDDLKVDNFQKIKSVQAVNFTK